MLETFRSGRLSVGLPSYARVKRYAFKGDGVGNYIRIPNSPSLAVGAGFTMMGWVKPPNNPANHAQWFGKRDGANLDSFYVTQLVGTNKLECRFRGAGGWWDITPVPVAIPNVLNRIAFVKDGNSIYGYLNGVLAGSNTGLLGALTNTTDYFIGAENGASRYLKGLVCEVLFYNRALTALERTHNERYPFDAVRDGLVLEYLLKTGSGATAYDTSGFGNNGTFNGASYWDMLGDDVLTFERT